MKIEDEIRQQKFNSDKHKLAVNIIYSFNWLNTKISKEFAKFNLTSQQYNVLRILRGQNPNPVSVGLIKERMLQKISDSSRLVDRLEKKGLITRMINKNDRRKSDILISKKGLSVLKKIDPVANKFDDFFSNLLKKDVKTLNALLDKMRG